MEGKGRLTEMAASDGPVSFLSMELSARPTCDR